VILSRLARGGTEECTCYLSNLLRSEMLYFPDIAEQISRSPPKLMNLQSFRNTYIGLTYTEIEIDCNNITFQCYS
jgi:hypothetical protein